jgi:hypothetical protein
MTFLPSKKTSALTRTTKTNRTATDTRGRKPDPIPARPPLFARPVGLAR